MDDPVPIEGIIEGEPESLAAVCAAGGSAVIAYCATVGVRSYIPETVVTALATFRSGVVEHADQDPSQLEKLLLTSTADAVRRVAGLDPSPVQQAAAAVALDGAVTTPLPAGLAPRIIHALVQAAPVTALGGDPAAVRRATEQQYIRKFDGAAPSAASVAPPASAAQAPPPGAASPPPATPRLPAGEAAWLPPELAVLDAETLNARAIAPPTQWTTPAEAPAAAQPPAEASPADAPPVAPPPHALVIKRGGHWPLRWPRRRQRQPPHGSRLGRGRNMIVAGAIAVAVAAAIFAATDRPDESVQQGGILVRPIGIPFTIDGAVFDIARAEASLWAMALRRRAPRPGHRWVTLAARTRNLSRTNFHPRGLGYRLRTPAGIVIGPTSARVPAQLTAAKGRLPIGVRSSVHLGFEVPETQDDLTLEFDPSPRAPRIRVPLN